MDFEFLFKHFGTVLAFWAVWQVLDFILYLSGMKSYVREVLENSKEEKVAKAKNVINEISLSLEEKIVKAVSRNLATLEVDISQTKAAVRELVKTEVRRMELELAGPDLLGGCVKHARKHKVGVKKVDPIPLADEVQSKPVKVQAKHVKKQKKLHKKPNTERDDGYTIMDVELASTRVTNPYIPTTDLLSYKDGRLRDIYSMQIERSRQ